MTPLGDRFVIVASGRGLYKGRNTHLLLNQPLHTLSSPLRIVMEAVKPIKSLTEFKELVGPAMSQSRLESPSLLLIAAPLAVLLSDQW